MTIRLVDREWDHEFINALSDVNELRIVCPFVKSDSIEKLLAHKPDKVQVITRFNLADLAEGVSDVSALGKLLDANARVRGVRNLHAKLYIFGSSRAIITSANLTQAALIRNHELGIVAEDSDIVQECRAYFDRLWDNAGDDLKQDQVDDWNRTITAYRLRGGRRKETNTLNDFGTDARLIDPLPHQIPTVVAEASQAFVKFLGKGDDRIPSVDSTLKHIMGGGCHWAVCYPASKRPRRVKDGAVIFMGWLTRDPNDVRVCGRAIGMKYEPGRDDATQEEINKRPWKNNYPRYIRVHQAEFVAGLMENGVSLNELMDTLKADSFVSTQRNVARGEGNTNPRRAYLQQAAVELSTNGLSWLGARLQQAFEIHGTIPQDQLDELDWPDPSLVLHQDVPLKG